MISSRNPCTCTLLVKKYSNLLLLCLILIQLYKHVFVVLKKNYKACVLTKLYHGTFHFESNNNFPDKSRDKLASKDTFSWRLVTWRTVLFTGKEKFDGMAQGSPIPTSRALLTILTPHAT